MERTVWKYPLPNRVNLIPVPNGAKVVHVGLDPRDGERMAWIEHRASLTRGGPGPAAVDHNDTLQRIVLTVVCTGDVVDDTQKHVGTIIDNKRGLVLHVYEGE